MKAVAIVCLFAIGALGQMTPKNPDSSWEVLSLVFGNQLSSSLSSPQILAHARISDEASIEKNGYRVLCASYITGQNIGALLFSKTLIFLKFNLQLLILSLILNSLQSAKRIRPTAPIARRRDRCHLLRYKPSKSREFAFRQF